jgi:hypothetical protein
MNKTPDFDAIIQRIAVADLEFQAAVDAERVSAPAIKAYEARRAELIAALDEARGTADVTYAQFRDAFDQGASCHGLFELRNRMHPKDPLKVAATEDLRSVECLSPRSTRRDRTDGEATQ